MKLLLCISCSDVFSLDYHTKSCKCGQTTGQYLDKQNAVYSGEKAIPLGMDNYSFAQAVHRQPENGLGCRFTAFVIPKECPTFIKERRVSK